MAYQMHTCGHTQCAPCHMAGYEKRETDYVCEYLDKRFRISMLTGAFVDIGAHVGLWSLRMSEWYIARYHIVPTILAIEADVRNFKVLVRNAYENKTTGITPHCAAAWDKNQPVVIHREKHPARYYVAGEADKQHCTPNPTIPTHTTVAGVMLDSIMRGEFDVMKIDVEGAEMKVVVGAKQLLINNPHALLVVEYSVDNFSRFNYKAAQLTDVLAECGFFPDRPIDEQTVKNITNGEIKRVMFIKGAI